ncbi:hypothetical protein HMPREF3033_00167 [Veillonellaceae bacterium DNF00751]|nr:hypothetical protein HMPREF3033_00167 [Veillonellaceae bacterium DNF00751]
MKAVNPVRSPVYDAPSVQHGRGVSHTGVFFSFFLQKVFTNFLLLSIIIVPVF